MHAASALYDGWVSTMDALPASLDPNSDCCSLGLRVSDGDVQDPVLLT